MKTREPNETGAYVFFFDVSFCSGSSSIISAYPDALKLASVMRTNCLPASGCFSDSLQMLSRVLFIWSKFLMSSLETVTVLSVFRRS